MPAASANLSSVLRDASGLGSLIHTNGAQINTLIDHSCGAFRAIH
jgi:hypothetical protein